MSIDSELPPDKPLQPTGLAAAQSDYAADVPIGDNPACNTVLVRRREFA